MNDLSEPFRQAMAKSFIDWIKERFEDVKRQAKINGYPHVLFIHDHELLEEITRWVKHFDAIVVNDKWITGIAFKHSRDMAIGTLTWKDH